MFSWTVVPATGFDMDGFIEKVLRHEDVSDDMLRNLRTWVFRCEMRVCLREMVSVAIDKLDADRKHPRALSFLVEFVAGLKYAFDDRSVGRMRELRMQFNCCTNRHAIGFLKSFCAHAWNEKLWKQKHLWFQLRVRCMDAYVLSHILNTSAPSIVYYAGSSHTHNTQEFLLRKGLASDQKERHDCAAWEALRGLANARRLSHVSSLKLKTGPRILLLGEEHHVTDGIFGTELIEQMQSLCDGDPVLFLIEKHITNDKDPLQCDLMCNQLNLALHRSRCSDFVSHEHNTCAAVQVVAVDNRHTDMGFLRVELMDLWDDDANFCSSAEEFQQSSILSMHNFCSTLLLCRKMRCVSDTETSPTRSRPSASKI